MLNLNNFSVSRSLLNVFVKYSFAAIFAIAFSICVAGQDTLNAQQGKRVSLTDTFSIYYKVDSIDINPTYLENKKNIAHILDYLQLSPRIDSITIYAWASPEGPYYRNKWLSRQRALTARRFLLDHVADSSRLNAEKIKISPIAENWDGLTKLVEEKYSKANRDKVLAILYDKSVRNDKKKLMLQNLDRGVTWRYMIRNYMPELRAATWVCVWVDYIIPLDTIPAPEVRLEQKHKPLERKYEERKIERKRTILGLKTNLLYDAATALNFSIEVPINEHFSFQYEHHCPWWLTRNNRYCLEFLSFGGEFRWWFLPKTKPESEKRKQRDALAGHFLGIHGWGGKADIQANRDFGCYQFDFFSAGLTYGYSMPVSRHLNLEFSISAGYARIPYQHYIPTPDWQILIRDKNNAGTLHYFGPTKAEVSLVIPIRAKIRRDDR